ncbi:MAG TPA: hypothetical protein VJ924_01110, partial [Alphaproteobacteria bacterium]|nr:hypothetical protein [Alphaproteobacteria bacterium]
CMLSSRCAISAELATIAPRMQRLRPEARDRSSGIARVGDDQRANPARRGGASTMLAAVGADRARRKQRFRRPGLLGARRSAGMKRSPPLSVIGRHPRFDLRIDPLQVGDPAGVEDEVRPIFRRSEAEFPADVQCCDFAQGDLPNALPAASKTNRAQQAMRSEIVSRYHIPYVYLICEPIFRHRTNLPQRFGISYEESIIRAPQHLKLQPVD